MSSSVLISVHDLQALLADPEQRPVVLDVRWQLGGPPGLDEFRRGHAPGAVYVDLDTALADPPGPGGRHPLPDRERFQEAMRAAGVSDGSPVVVYDAVGGTSAARCWWLLRYFGHADVRVLDGGWQAWLAADLPTARGDAPARPPGGFTADPGHLPVVDADGAARIARDGVLLDARAPERFRGEREPVDPVAGHVPGAVNLPATDNLLPAAAETPARFRAAGELEALYREAGVAPGRPVAAYCGSGVTAAHVVLTLAHLGVEAALYAGSWSEWVTDPERPVATGEGG